MRVLARAATTCKKAVAMAYLGNLMALTFKDGFQNMNCDVSGWHAVMTFNGPGKFMRLQKGFLARMRFVSYRRVCR
jgi:hypothetical protein